jgi:hypothetical protein
MYKVVAERIDPHNLVHRQEGYWSATSFSCIVTPESSYAKVWLEGGALRSRYLSAAGDGISNASSRTSPAARSSST